MICRPANMCECSFFRSLILSGIVYILIEIFKYAFSWILIEKIMRNVYSSDPVMIDF